MENHNPGVNMDGDMNKYARRGVPPMNHVWPYPRHQYNQYSHCAHMYHEAVPQQSQMQVQEMSHVQNQTPHVQMPQVSQMQQPQASQIQQAQVNQMQQQSQVTQLQQSQASQMQQQSQVGQIQQASLNQMQQAQVSQMQQPQIAQMQQIQVQPAQLAHAQVQSTDSSTAALSSPAQQVTIVTNPLPNPAMGPLHDALTNRMNQNMKLNATVTVPSSQAAVSIQTPSVQTQSSKAHMEPQPSQILTRARMQDLVREVDPNEQLDDDVEEILLQMADDFVESSITAACLLAKHRKSSTVEVKDLQLHLERNWNMWIPGFGTDELRPYKRSSVNDAHKQRLTLIRKTLKKY